MTDGKRPDKRSTNGRFAPGNSFGKGPRRRSAVELATLVDNRLKGSQSGSLEQLAVDAIVRIAKAAADGDVRAAEWIVDRFYPTDRDAAALPKLPSPSQSPREFVDALAQAVSDGRLSASKAASLSQLSRAFLSDEAFRHVIDELEQLRAKVAEIEHGEQRAAAEQCAH
jgi:hypothetical protein